MRSKMLWLACFIILGGAVYLLTHFPITTKMASLIINKNVINIEPETRQPVFRPGDTFFETYREGDLRIARLGPGYSWRDVRKIYGEPLAKELKTEQAVNNPEYNFYRTTWFYPGFSVQFGNSGLQGNPQPSEIGQVWSVVVTSQKYQTFRGIRVGDAVAKVEASYGPASKDSFYVENKESLIYEYQLSYIGFIVLNGKVTGIEIGCLPD